MHQHPHRSRTNALKPRIIPSVLETPGFVGGHPKSSWTARRALFFLARGRRTVAEIAAQGIKGEVLSGLVKAGLASKVVERIGRGVLATEITRGWQITAAGRQALGET